VAVAAELREAAVAYANRPDRKTAVGPMLEEAERVTGIHDFRITLFDNDTRLLFATSFDTDWEPYVLDSIRLMKGISAWGQFLKYTVEAPDGVEVPGKISDTQGLEFLNKHRIRAAAYDDTFKDMPIALKQKATRVYNAFQKVLDNPEAAEALKHPALKPLLDLASD